MAKMFYTLQEVAQKLAKSEDEVKEMASSGQIQEFRDRDKLMFKVDQIDLLTGADDEDTGDVNLDLADSALGTGGSAFDLGGSALELGDSGLEMIDSAAGMSSGVAPAESGVGLSESGAGTDIAEPELGSMIGLSDSFDDSNADSREGTGISVFDTDAGLGDPADMGVETQIGDTLEDDDLSLEAVGSGSGLLDLTRESDDTSLGAELLEEVYSSDENIEIPANASGLFEAAGAESAGNLIGEPTPGGGLTMPVMVEAYDGAGSGLSVGLMIGAMAALVLLAIVSIVGVTGNTPEIAMQFADNFWIWAGGLAGATVIFGLIGLFIGKASG